MIEVGTVFEEPPRFDFGVVPQDFEELPDPRDAGPPKTLAEVASECDVLRGWIHAEYVSDPRHIVAARLCELLEAASMLPEAPPTPFDVAAIRCARSVPDQVRLAKVLRQWATIEEPPGAGGQADSKADKKPKKSHPVPVNPDILKLAKKLKKDREKEMSLIDIAREFCEGNERRAQSLLRQVRRYPGLWK
jgi:hypothetical protein